MRHFYNSHLTNSVNLLIPHFATDAKATKMDKAKSSRAELSSYTLVGGQRLCLCLSQPSPLFSPEDIYTADSAKSSSGRAGKEDFGVSSRWVLALVWLP